ncbi:MAG: type II CAAX prenyl endopeptidase Rce1 family protein [Haloarculaceae archaeon]
MTGRESAATTERGGTDAVATGHPATTLRGGVALFALGMVGVLALAVTSVPALRTTPGLEALPFPALVALAAINSTLLLAVFVALGALTAPRVGLRSHVFERAARGETDWAAFRESVPTAAAVGAALFVVATVLDVAFAPFVTVSAPAVGTDAETLAALAASIPLRLLYGGVTEELLLRWGVLAPVAWALWRGGTFLGRRSRSRSQSRSRSRSRRPSAATMWAAVVVSAVLFGAGHLPALAASFGLTPALIVRTVVINAVVGVGLGWLFWRRSVETAMVAHASFHVALLAVSTVVVVAT